MKSACGFAVLTLSGLFFINSLGAIEIDSDQMVTNGAPLISSSPGSISIIPRKPATGVWLYDWTDIDGDGIPGPSAAPGLNVHSFSLKHQLDISKIGETTIRLNLAGGDFSGTSGYKAVDFYYNMGSYTYNGIANFELINAGNVDVGVLDTHGNGLQYRRSGFVKLGEPIGQGFGPVGAVRVDDISTWGTLGYNSSGHAQIYSSGDVFIQRANDTLGTIKSGNVSGSAGDITVLHEGAFVAGKLESITQSDYTSLGVGGNITLNGDADGDGNLAACLIGGIDASYRGTGSNGLRGGNVSIRNYDSVNISQNIASLSASTSNIRIHYGGNVTIQDIAGDITIGGTIDVGVARIEDTPGTVVLESSNGNISLNTLDLARVSSISFSTPKKAEVIDLLKNFNTYADSGTGSMARPYVTTQLVLRASADTVIEYAYEENGINNYLDRKIYRLPSPDGVPGAGGLLVPAIGPKVGGTMLQVR
jgi:hypothetical protein